MSEFPHESWVTDVSSSLRGHFLTTSYDGHLRVFTTSNTQAPTLSAPLHSGAITSFSLLPSEPLEELTSTIVTSSHDLTALISRLDLQTNSCTPLASLHLHTGPVSSVSTLNTHILTSGWDGLIGFFDVSIPSSDEVPLPATASTDRKKRRKIAKDDEVAQPKRKAPLSVLKSHIGRVSKVLWNGPGKAVSVGFDSTVRTWDTEMGVCTGNIAASEKPFLGLALSHEQAALAVSTDRTLTSYDLRMDTLSAATASFLHPATPSCVGVPATAGEGATVNKLQVATGAYDGVVRIWDMRSTKTAVALFKAWGGSKNEGKKVLGLEWRGDLLTVGGEGGVDVWKVSGSAGPDERKSA